ncbi:hypothetical protein C5167_019653 [Papaver somniferum]|uniref:Uncharacterized protein n=1 Tax=Papaver somniferum TaxID=3469 RepID=A0A4Y7ITW7_PAPSO|nr:hypothetical protein C5167_019653 [Papaver somniferum]
MMVLSIQQRGLMSEIESERIRERDCIEWNGRHIARACYTSDGIMFFSIAALVNCRRRSIQSFQYVSMVP